MTNYEQHKILLSNKNIKIYVQIKRSQIRKGMVMVSPALNPQACWEFEGEILVLHHPTTISSRYQAMGNKFALPKNDSFQFLIFLFLKNSALWQH